MQTAALATVAACRLVCSAVLDIDSAVVRSSLAPVPSLDTSAPTVRSKSSAVAFSDAFWASAAAAFSLSWAATRRVRSIMFVLNTSTALAISPISSPRPTPGTSTDVSPVAKRCIAAVMRLIGTETARMRPKPIRTFTTVATPIMTQVTVKALLYDWSCLADAARPRFRL